MDTIWLGMGSRSWQGILEKPEEASQASAGWDVLLGSIRMS